jgi:hypothetical protein
MAGFPYDRSLTSMSYQEGIAVRDDDDGDDIDVNQGLGKCGLDWLVMVG